MGLGLLFRDEDKIFICNVGENGTTNEFVGNVFEVTNELQKKPRNFYSINPVRGQRRLKKEVRRYANFLIESDTTPLEKQFELLPSIMDTGIVRAAVFSGGKSIHFLISCMDDLHLGEPGSDTAEQAYKQIWQGLAQIFDGLGLDVSDASNKNPVTLSRLPGMFRNDTEQKLLATGKMVDAAFLKSVAVNYESKPSIQTAGLVTNITELEKRLNSAEHSRLNMYLKYPAWITEGNGNYPMLYRLTLWAAEEVGATPDTFFTYLEKHLVPHLHAKHYFKDWSLPVEHAFRKKGLL